MSDTKKTTPQTHRESTENLRDAARGATDAGAKTARDAAVKAEDVFNRAADDARDIGAGVSDTVAQATDAAMDIGERAVEQGRDVMWLGVRAAAGVNGRLADANYGRGHRVLESATRAMDIYRDASESTAENVQALFASYLQMGRGVQQMQHACLEMMGRSTESAAHKPQDLLRCRSLEEFAEIQRDLYIDSVNRAMEVSSTLFQMAGRITQDAMKPLQNSRTQLVRV